MAGRKCELCGRTVSNLAFVDHRCPHGQPCRFRPYKAGIGCRKCHRAHKMYREWEQENERQRNIRRGAA